MISAILRQRQQTTPTAWTFWFEPEQRVRFTPGQYVELTVPHNPVDDRGLTRWMSIASSPGERQIAITTTFSPRQSTYKQALLAMWPGDTVLLGEPFGDFVAPVDRSIPLAFVAGGIGIAPVRSIVQSLAEQSDRREIQLIHSAPAPEELAFAEIFEAYGLHYTPIVTRRPVGWRGATGRLTAAQVLALVGETAGKLLYLSGPQSLIEPLFDALLHAGVSRAQLVLDYFPGY